MRLSVRLPRREVLVIAAAALLAVAVTLVILATTGGGRAPRSTAPEPAQQKKASTITGLTTEDLSLTPEDFILPELRTGGNAPTYYPFRPRLGRWSKEMIDKYWIPPREIAIDILSRINDQAMERLFQNVP